MLIDWPTVAAQIVNFLILLALLKWLLFDRVVRAMDEREKKIAKRLEDAQQKREEAERRSEELGQQHRQLEAQRQEKLQQAKDEADQQRRELVRQARDEVDQLRREWKQALQQQQRQFIENLSERAGDALRRALHQALTDLADDDLQQGTVRVFLDRLEDVDGQKRDRLRQAIEDADGQVTVVSARELSDGARRRIADALKRHLHDRARADFETSPELISGLEIRAHGQALGWNLRRYVEQFGEMLGRTMGEELQSAGPASEPSPSERSSPE